jgi:membrane protein required for colicin V production
MHLVDIAIVLLVVLSAVLGFRSGIIQSVFSLLGLIAGISIASWHYQRFADELAPLLHIKHQAGPLADAIWFCLIALVVMLAAGLIGMLIRSVVHGVGLGWLDRLLGFVFGLLRGGLLVTLCVVILAAFFPDTRWLGDAQLAKYFWGSAYVTTWITPEEVKLRILDGLHVLERDAPEWLYPK